MTKNNFKITNKLPLWLAIPAVIILAGLILFFLLGFNPSASVANNKALLISHDAYINTSEEFGEDLKEVCETEIEKAGLEVIGCNAVTTAKGGQLEYTFAPDTANDKLYTLWENIETALSADENLKFSIYSATVHENVSQYAYEYIWRAAISVGVALALAFVYVAIRYRLSMGLATLIAGIADVAVMLSLAIILQIPVTTALATAAIFATLYSILVSTVFFNKARTFFKSEEYASMPAAEVVELANGQSVKNVLLLGVSAAVFFALLAIFGGSAIRVFALPAICAVAASTFSGALLTPSLVGAFKANGDKMKAKKEEKKRLAKQKEEEAKAQKRNTKKD